MLSCVNHFLPDTPKSSGIALTCFKLEECYKKLKENQDFQSLKLEELFKRLSLVLVM